MKKTAIIRFGKRLFICELKPVTVKGGKTVEKVYCRELRRKKRKSKDKTTLQLSIPSKHL